MDKLAILGGKKAIDTTVGEKWQRPKEQEKVLIEQLIETNELSGAGFGIGKNFEDAYAKYTGCRYCLAFSHGTAALMAAYYAVGVGPGDEVITPAVGYIASYSGAMHMGARPVFCDIDPKNLLIDPECIRKKITVKTKAINIIHLNGRICNLDDLLDISDAYSIPIIDDASHAHGASWDGKKLGNSNHITCFSMQGVPPYGKAVGAGEGGIACTNDRTYYQRMLAYCHLHRKNLKEELAGSPYEGLDSEVLGLKWRPHPLAMGLALTSLESLDDRNRSRTVNYKRTVECLQKFPFFSIPETHDKAEMGGFYGGLKFIFEPSTLGNMPTGAFIRCLQAEGILIGGPKVGDLEYRRSLFSKGFDLWGRGRGPLGGAWQGLEAFHPCRPEEFPIAEEMNAKVFTLASYIDVDDAYYSGLETALKKLEQQYESLGNFL